MNLAIDDKYYLFFVRDILPQPEAHLVQMVNLADAAANLGYRAVLVYLDRTLYAYNPLNLASPFRPQQPDQEMVKYYNIQDKLQVATLPMPWPIDRLESKLTNSSTLSCKYYLPVHLQPKTKIVHSRDWNFVKAAVERGIPAIYERDHCESKKYEPEIVNNPQFKVTVTVTETIKDNLIENGMPAEKIICLHNGFNQVFVTRHPEAAQEWRRKLLAKGHQQLVVYCGALYPFKGINLLIKIAKDLPQVQFALAGGPESQIQAYQQMLREQQITNVTLVGYLPQRQLAGLLQAADALVYPHLAGEAANTTSPMKLFDYIAAGKPIVATTIPPLKEFQASPLVAGWSEPNNPTQFSQCLQQVLHRYPQWSEEHLHYDNMGLVQQFSWEHRIKQTLDCV